MSRSQLALLPSTAKRSEVGSCFSIKTQDAGCRKEVMGGKGLKRVRVVFLSANLLQDQRVDFKGSGRAGSLLGAP